METSVKPIGQPAAGTSSVLKTAPLIPRDMRPNKGDRLDLGKRALNSAQAMNIVMERAMDKLRGVVTDARAALGIPEGAVIDTSPEATGNRIADFAIGAFGAWQKRHADVPEGEARQQFAAFIGAAVQQGVQEARGILSALNAMNPTVDSNINSTWDVVQQRLADFVGGK
jgi:hypothetical protein